MLAGPVNAPLALNLLTAVRLRFMDAYSQAYQDRAYSDYLDFVYLDDPAGDLIYTIYAEPMKPLRVWLADRPMSSTDFRFWTQSVRTFGDGNELDVDDMKDDANPAKRIMYLMAAQRLAESAVGLWPSLLAETLIKGITSKWLPDGQNILDLHPFSPSVSLGNFRNYYANSTQGGGAAFPLTYGNLRSVLRAGLAFKAPTGLDYPIIYNTLAVPPGSARDAQRLVQFDRLPTAEVASQSLSTSNMGGDAKNEVQALYAPEVKVIANMPAGTWSLIDARLPSERPLAIKKRQDITWQYVGPSGGAIDGMTPVVDSGAVSDILFRTNKTKYGPKARGDGFFRNWWRVAFCDGNPTPVTSLSIVS